MRVATERDRFLDQEKQSVPKKSTNCAANPFFFERATSSTSGSSTFTDHGTGKICTHYSTFVARGPSSKCFGQRKILRSEDPCSLLVLFCGFNIPFMANGVLDNEGLSMVGRV